MSRIVRKPVYWFVKQMGWLVSVWCGFLLNGVSEQTLILILWHMYTIWTKHYLISIVKILKPIIKAMMPKILFIIFSNFNLLMKVMYILFVEAILGSFEFVFLNRQYFLSMFLRVF